MLNVCNFIHARGIILIRESYTEKKKRVRDTASMLFATGGWVVI